MQLRRKIILIIALIVFPIMAVLFFRTQHMSKKNFQNNTDLPQRLATFSMQWKKPDEDTDHYVQSQMDACFKQGKDACYRTVADLFFAQFSLKETLALFAKNEDVPAVFARCHQVTHYVSRLEYQKTKDLPETFSSCNFTCHGGCYHGALEEYLSEKQLLSGNDQEAVRHEISTVCGKREDYKTPLVFRECVHGLGHGAMYITDSDVPKALHLCDALGSQEEQAHCYSGVFMENSSSSTNLDHQSTFIDPKNPMYPCDFLDNKYLSMCYRYQSSYFALLTNHDWKKTAGLCMQVPEPYRKECFVTIGSNQVGFTQNMNVMRDNCRAMPTSEFQQSCIAGVVMSLTGRYVGDAQKVLTFCESVWSEGQESCYDQFGRSIRDWSVNEDQRIQLCEHIVSSDGKKWCRGEKGKQ